MTTIEDAIRLAREATDNQPLYGRKEFTFSAVELEKLITLAQNEALRKAAEVCEGLGKSGIDYFNHKAFSTAILALVKEV